MPEFYTWTILLINQLDEIGEKQLSVFGFRGGQVCPLMHVPLSTYVNFESSVSTTYFQYIHLPVCQLPVRVYWVRGFFKQTEKNLRSKEFFLSLICCCVKDLLCKTDILLPILKENCYSFVTEWNRKTKPLWMSGLVGTGPCKLLHSRTIYAYSVARSGLKDIKLFTFSTKLSMKVIKLINVKYSI